MLNEVTGGQVVSEIFDKLIEKTKSKSIHWKISETGYNSLTVKSSFGRYTLSLKVEFVPVQSPLVLAKETDLYIPQSGRETNIPSPTQQGISLGVLLLFTVTDHEGEIIMNLATDGRSVDDFSRKLLELFKIINEQVSERVSRKISEFVSLITSS